MPMRTATTVTFFYALGYPIGNLAVHALSPMAVLAVRFGLAGLVLGDVGSAGPGQLPHRAQAASTSRWRVCSCRPCSSAPCTSRFEHGAPAVLCAVVIAMNPVATALLAAMFLRDRLTPRRVVALVLGVAAVLAACATRLVGSGGIDPVVGLLLVALLGLAAGGVYQQRFCSDVDFRASTSVQNAVAFIPALALALTTPVEVHDVTKAVLAVAGVVLLERHPRGVAVRAGHQSARCLGGRDAVLRDSRGGRGVVLVDARRAGGPRHRRRSGPGCGRVLAERVRRAR